MPKRKQPGHNPTKGQRVAAETRRYQMLELTKAGATERQIAEALNVNRAYVHREVKRVLSDLAQLHSRTADSVRALQMERYTTLLARWWQQAIAGDETANHMVLRLMQRIDVINGIIPDKPLIDMRTQTIQIDERMGLMELARAIANGSGHVGANGDGPGNRGQSGALSNGSTGSDTLPEAG